MAGPGPNTQVTELSKLVNSSSEAWQENSVMRAPHRAVIDRPHWICFLGSLCVTQRESAPNEAKQKWRDTESTVRRSHNTEGTLLFAVGAVKEVDGSGDTLTKELPLTKQ